MLRAATPQIARRNVAVPCGESGSVKWIVQVVARPSASAGTVIVNDVRNLFEIPVFPEIASADRVVHILREQLGVLQIHSPVEVVVAFEELRAGPIGNSDVPELPAETHGFPFQPAEIDGLSRLDGHIGLGVFAQNSVGDGVQLVNAGANLGIVNDPSLPPRTQNS